MSARPARGARQLLRDLAALVLGEGVAKLAGFVAFAYLARTLPPERYGAVELAAAITMLFFLVVDFGFAPVGARELARDGTQVRWLAAAIPTLRLGLALASVAGIAVASLFLDQPEETRTLVRVFALSLLMAPWILNWLFQGLGRMLVVAAAQALRMAAFALLVFVVVSPVAPLWHAGAAELAAATILALYYLAMQASIAGTPQLSADVPRLVRLLRDAAPIGVSRILWATSQYAGTVILAAFAPASEVAWYGAAHRLATALGAFVQLYHFNLFPTLVEAAGDSLARLRELLEPLVRAAGWLAAFGGLVGVMFGAPLCALLYGAPFAQSGEPFAVLVWTLSASLVGAHARNVLLALGQQRAELAANAAGAAITLAASVALVPRFGGLGAGAALVAGTLATWLAAHALASRSAAGALPGLALLLRPLLTGAAVGFAASRLPIANEIARSSAALLALALAAPLVDPALRREALRLLRARGVQS
jgi:O-antigen/teichoic acid export membrane protein